MAIETYTFHQATNGFCDVLDVTPLARQALADSGLEEGLLTVVVPGSTAGITTIEFEPGAVADLKAAISRLAPDTIPYEHDLAWGDGNGFSHVRAALLGPSRSFPFTEGELLLGTWQQVVLVDFDNGPRRRRLLIQVMGDEGTGD
jgi:secondary thiamine-phosphate synthase enzyme